MVQFIAILFFILCSARPVYAFELSSWVDVSLSRTLRGYIYPYTDTAHTSPETAPNETEITNTLSVLKREYRINKLYLIYTRQFEPSVAKQVFALWNKANKVTYTLS